MVCHIGDGRAGYRKQSGEWQSLITPWKGEEANQTVFITSAIWNAPEKFLKSSVVNDVPTAFTLMSDGCESHSFELGYFDQQQQQFIEKNNPYPKFFDPLVEQVKKMDEGGMSSNEIHKNWRQFLTNGSQGLANESDDKTMILNTLKLNHLKMAKHYTTSKGAQISLEDTPFAKGGEGSIFYITHPANFRSHCAKIYIDKYQDAQKKKIKHMISNPPANLKNKGYLVCWPEETLYSNGKFVGFIMPLAFSESQKLYSLCLPDISNELPPIWRTKYNRGTSSGITGPRLKLCVNIAVAIHSIHRSNQYVLVDMKPHNLLMTDDGRISMTDMDSVQIANNKQNIFSAHVATPEYVPPEGTQLNPSKDYIPESWDRFSWR